VVRGSCDVPTQGYLILSVRGERLWPCLVLGDQSGSSDSGQDGSRSPPELNRGTHTLAHIRTLLVSGGNEAVINASLR